jgi:predicted phosphodiesterase
MKYALITDIHGNLEALDAVLKEIETAGISPEHTGCLGDMVGYGPYPNECVDKVRRRCGFVVHGNHELSVVSGIPKAYIHSSLFEMMKWTKKRITQENLEWMAQLPAQTRFRYGIVAHGQPIYGDKIFDYERVNNYVFIEEGKDATFVMSRVFRNLKHHSKETGNGSYLAAFGHTHEGWAMIENDRFVRLEPDFKTRRYENPDKALMIASVPSVGLPRDGDWRSGWLEVDAHGVTLHRTEYDVQATIDATIHEAVTDGVMPLQKGTFKR